jgi:hypothetical protein
MPIASGNLVTVEKPGHGQARCLFEEPELEEFWSKKRRLALACACRIGTTLHDAVAADECLACTCRLCGKVRRLRPNQEEWDQLKALVLKPSTGNETIFR